MSSSPHSLSTYVFVNHEGSSKPLAIRIWLACTALGINCFFDRNGLHAGGDFPSDIQSAILQTTIMIALMDSRHINKEWPVREVIEYMRKDNAVIIPVFLHKDWRKVDPNSKCTIPFQDRVNLTEKLKYTSGLDLTTTTAASQDDFDQVALIRIMQTLMQDVAFSSNNWPYNRAGGQSRSWYLSEATRLAQSFAATNFSENMDPERVQSLSVDVHLQMLNDVKEAEDKEFDASLQHVDSRGFFLDNAALRHNGTSEQWLRAASNWWSSPYEATASSMSALDIRVCSLLGEVGCGKTVVSGALYERMLREVARPILVTHACRRSDQRTRTNLALVHSVVRQLAEQVSDIRQELLAILRLLPSVRDRHGGPEALWQALIVDPLCKFNQEASNPLDILVIIDGLDEAEENLLHGLKYAFAAVPNCMRFFVCGRPQSLVNHITHGSRRIELTYSDSEEDLKRFVHSQLQGSPFVHDAFLDTKVSEVCAVAKGQFLFARYLVDEIRQAPVTNLPQSIDAFYGEVFSRAVNDYSPFVCILIWKALDMLVVARTPPNLALVAGYVQDEHRCRMQASPSTVPQLSKNLISDLAKYFQTFQNVIKTVPSTSSTMDPFTLVFVHDSVREFLLLPNRKEFLSEQSQETPNLQEGEVHHRCSSIAWRVLLQQPSSSSSMPIASGKQLDVQNAEIVHLNLDAIYFLHASASAVVDPICSAWILYGAHWYVTHCLATKDTSSAIRALCHLQYWHARGIVQSAVQLAEEFSQCATLMELEIIGGGHVTERELSSIHRTLDELMQFSRFLPVHLSAWSKQPDLLYALAHSWARGTAVHAAAEKFLPWLRQWPHLSQDLRDKIPCILNVPLEEFQGGLSLKLTCGSLDEYVNRVVVAAKAPVIASTTMIFMNSAIRECHLQLWSSISALPYCEPILLPGKATCLAIDDIGLTVAAVVNSQLFIWKRSIAEVKPFTISAHDAVNSPLGMECSIVAFGFEGKLLVTGNNEGSLRIWLMPQLLLLSEQLNVFHSKLSKIDIREGHGGLGIVCASDESGRIRIWQLSYQPPALAALPVITWKELSSPPPIESSSLINLACHSNGAIQTMHANGRVSQWNCSSHVWTSVTLDFKPIPHIPAKAVFSSDGSKVLIMLHYSWKLFRTSDGTSICEAVVNGIRCGALNASGSHVLIGLEDGTVCMYLTDPAMYKIDGSSTGKPAWLSECGHRVVSEHIDGWRLWQVGEDQVSKSEAIDRPGEHTEVTGTSSSGITLAFCTTSQEYRCVVHLLDLRTALPLSSDCPLSRVDEATAISVEDDASCVLVAFRSGNALCCLSLENENRLAEDHAAQCPRILSKKWTSSHPISNDTYAILIRTYPEGQVAMTAHRHGVIILWKLANGAALSAINTCSNGLHSISVAPDFSQFVLGDVEGKVRILRTTPQLHEIFSFQAFQPDSLGTAFVSVAFDAARQLIYTGVQGSADRLLKVWNAQTGVELPDASFNNHNGIYDLQISRDGRVLLVVTSTAWALVPTDMHRPFYASAIAPISHCIVGK